MSGSNDPTSANSYYEASTNSEYSHIQDRCGSNLNSTSVNVGTLSSLNTQVSRNPSLYHEYQPLNPIYRNDSQDSTHVTCKELKRSYVRLKCLLVFFVAINLAQLTYLGGLIANGSLPLFGEINEYDAIPGPIKYPFNVCVDCRSPMAKQAQLKENSEGKCCFTNVSEILDIVFYISRLNQVEFSGNDTRRKIYSFGEDCINPHAHLTGIGNVTSDNILRWNCDKQGSVRGVICAEDGRLGIKCPGFYLVYSHVVFTARNDGKATKTPMSHIIRYESNGVGERNLYKSTEGVLVATNSKQRERSSYLAGVQELKKSDKLSVRLSHDSLHSDNYFGIYYIGA